MTNSLTGRPHSSPARPQASDTRSPCQLASEGADVIVHGRNAERGAKTVTRYRKCRRQGTFRCCDVSDASDVRRLADERGRRHPVNNAGIYPVRPDLRDTDADIDDHIKHQPEARTSGPELVPGMVQRGHGTVINVTTRRGHHPAAWRGHRMAPARPAVELLTKLWPMIRRLGRAGQRRRSRTDADTGHRGIRE